MKKITFYLFLCISVFSVNAQGYKISVNWSGLSDSTIHLAHYFDVNIYLNDSIKLDRYGKGTFKGDSLLREGLYVLYLNKDTYFDFLIGKDQEFQISAKNNDLQNSILIEGAVESEDFRKYQRSIMEKSKLRNELIEKSKSKDSIDSKEAISSLEKLDEEVKKFLSSEIERTKGTMYSLFLKTSNNTPIPDPPFDKNTPKYDSLAWFYYYNYRRDHFLDHIDFNDDRVLNTPLIKSNLDNYFNKILIQSPDSVVPQAIKLIRKCEPTKNTYQYVSQYLLNNGIQSKIMGMDALFVAVADEVYLKGKATWITDSVLTKIREEAFLIRPNMLGKKAPELVMENIDGERVSLHQLQADYTILVFYEYDCGHCKKEIPLIYTDVYMKHIDKNIEVFAVCSNDDSKEKWKEFVDSNQLSGWHHVWDPSRKSRFGILYNLKTTPLIYLLDKDKKIIAKKIDHTTLITILDTLIKK